MLLHLYLYRVLGLVRVKDGALVKEYSGPEQAVDYIAQMSVDEVECVDPRFQERPSLSVAEEYPLGSYIFFLGAKLYGCPGQVIGHMDDTLEIRLAASTSVLYIVCILSNSCLGIYGACFYPSWCWSCHSSTGPNE
jgi:hypothetical protein